MQTVRQGGFTRPDGKAWIIGQPEVNMILEWQGIRGRIIHIDDSDVSVRWENSPAIIDYSKAEFDNLLRRGEFEKK